MKKKNPVALAAKRPAETGTLVIGAILYFAQKFVDLSTEDVAYLLILIAFAPTAITWVVELVRST